MYYVTCCCYSSGDTINLFWRIRTQLVLKSSKNVKFYYTISKFLMGTCMDSQHQILCIFPPNLFFKRGEFHFLVFICEKNLIVDNLTSSFHLKLIFYYNLGFLDQNNFYFMAKYSFKLGGFYITIKTAFLRGKRSNPNQKKSLFIIQSNFYFINTPPHSPPKKKHCWYSKIAIFEITFFIHSGI